MGEYIYIDGSRIKNLKNKTFGQLYVEDFVKIENRYAVWKCTCLKCGKDCNVSAKNLQSGRQDACPSCKVPKQRKKRAESLNGKDFGLLHVENLVPDDKYEKYLCSCKCGNTKIVSRSNLISGNVKSCGCISRKNIKGHEFGFLKALHPTKESTKDGIVWNCKCKCGGEINVPVQKLVKGDIRSCGCMQEIEETQHTKIVWAVNGQKLRSNNTSGYRGVNRANGKWGARIRFQKKSYWLGTFDKKEDAIAARKAAEQHLYSDFLNWFEEYKGKNNCENVKYYK